MSIRKVKIKNFKHFRGWFEVEFSSGINILVGDNETGKSTILEAINLALTGYYRGRSIRNELSQYLFNKMVLDEYFEKLNKGDKVPPPDIVIEIYFRGDFAEYEGDGNSEGAKEQSGIVFSIVFDEEYVNEYKKVDFTTISTLPIEYYKVGWESFAREEITPRAIPVKSSMIDSSNYRYSNASEAYVLKIIKNLLKDEELVDVSRAHRLMKESFNNEESIKMINDSLNNSVNLITGKVSLSVDLGTKNSWENSLVTEFNNIPYLNAGKGTQCIIKTELALSDKKTVDKPVILLEEPECHLSHSNLNVLLKAIADKYQDKQLILSTHSSFVANKLGISNLILLGDEKVARISNLSDETARFFKKVAGYDTLRLLLCKKAILVEGDSDELVLQKAYMVNNDGKLPIHDGIDVISVGTSFLRFLELAEKLNKEVVVVTDNDGDVGAIEKKYNEYLGENKKEGIRICYDPVVHSGELKDFNYNTLEPALLRENGLEKLNTVLETTYPEELGLLKYMRRNKTECAIALFDTEEEVYFPEYILEAINGA